MFKPFLSQIVSEAHARARLDLDFEKANPPKFRAPHPYSYFLGLQMRSGFAEKRAELTGMAPAFQIVEPSRWAGTPSRR